MAFALWIEAKTKTPASAATTSTRGVFMSISFPRDFVSYKHGSKGKDSLTATRRKTSRERGGYVFSPTFLRSWNRPDLYPTSISPKEATVPLKQYLLCLARCLC